VGTGVGTTAAYPPQDARRGDGSKGTSGPTHAANVGESILGGLPEMQH
jgi:hypothetical protein